MKDDLDREPSGPVRQPGLEPGAHASIPRGVRRIDLTGPADAHGSQDLAQLIAAELRNVQTTGQFGCLVVEVAPHDGMTWAANTVANVVIATWPKARLWTLQPDRSPDDEAWLPDLFSPRQVARLARKSRITSAVGPSLRRSVLTVATRSADMVRLRRDVAAAVGSPNYATFIRGLAEVLGSAAADRVIIVDDFSALSRPVADVVLDYLSRAQADRRAPELWVLFDVAGRSSPSRLRQAVLLANFQGRLAFQGGSAATRHPPRVRSVKLYELERLTVAERHQLSVSMGGADWVNRVQHDPRLRAAVDLLYVLSLAAPGERDVVWPERTVGALLMSGRARSNVLDALWSNGRGSLRRQALRACLATIRSELREYIVVVDAVDQNGFRVDPDTSHILERALGASRLPSKVGAHVFWALFWYDRSDWPTEFRNVITAKAHLVSIAGTSGDLVALLRTGAANVPAVLFDVAMDTVERSIRIGSLEGLSEVTTFAAALIDKDGPAASGQFGRLHQTAWNVYRVLRDESVRSVLPDRQLDRSAAEGDIPAVSILDPNESMNIQLVSTWDARTGTALALDPLGGLSDPLGRPTAVGHWLAVSLLPFVLPPTALLARLVRNTRTSSGTYARQAVAAAGNAPGGIGLYRAGRVADMHDMSIALWTWALAGASERTARTSRRHAGQHLLGLVRSETTQIRSGDLEADLRDPRHIAATLAAAHRLLDHWQHVEDTADASDTVLAALTEELTTTILASVLLVMARWSHLADQDRSRLEAILAELVSSPHANGTAGRRVSATSILDQRFALLTATWAELGYRHFSNDIAAVHAQFAVSHLAAGDPAEQAAIALAGPEAVTHVLALLARAEGLLLTDHHGLAVARAFAQAVESAMSLDELSEEFRSQLCLLALGRAHALDIDLTRIVDYLLDRETDGSGRRRLDGQLASVPDEHLEEVALWITDVGWRPPHRVSLVAALRDRSSAAVERRTSTRVDNIIDMSEIGRGGRDLTAPQVLDILDSWAERRRDPYYAQLIHVLYRRTLEPVERLRSAAIDVLRDWAQYVGNTGIVLLAIHMLKPEPYRAGAHGLFDTATEEAALEVLHRTWTGFEGLLTPQLNLRVLRALLSHGDGDSSRIWEALTRWTTVQLEVIAARRPDADAGLFLVYVELLTPFGLPVRGPAEATLTKEDLLGSGPPPIAVVDGIASVSADCVHWAHALRSEEFRDDPELDGARQSLDDTVRSAMPRLYELASTLDLLPAATREVLSLAFGPDNSSPRTATASAE